MLRTGATSWSSRKQKIITLWTTKAEFVAPTTYACQAVSLRRILEELQYKQERLYKKVEIQRHFQMS